MAAVTNLLATPFESTTNSSTYTTPSVTPAAGDLLIVFVGATGKGGALTSISDSLGGAYVMPDFFLATSSADMITIGVASQLASGSSLTVTVNTGSAATGCAIHIAKVTGMTNVGNAAVRQHNGTDNGTSGTTPAPSFGVAALTSNPTVGMVGSGSLTAVTPPTNWTELAEGAGFITPNWLQESVGRDSGFTGTTITWGNTRAAVFGAYIMELDASGAAAAVIPDVNMAEIRA